MAESACSEYAGEVGFSPGSHADLTADPDIPAFVVAFHGYGKCAAAGLHDAETGQAALCMKRQCGSKRS